jgi:hypothetical protein
MRHAIDAFAAGSTQTRKLKLVPDRKAFPLRRRGTGSNKKTRRCGLRCELGRV